MTNSESENSAEQSTPGGRWKDVVTYTPLVIGLLALVALRTQGDLGNTQLLAGAFFLIALSCLIYSLLPGAGEITVQQDLALKQIGFKYQPWMGRLANGAASLLLIAVAVFLILP